MNNPLIVQNSIEEQNYFSKENLLKNFLSVSIIYISIISLASYFVYSTVISYSLFVFSLLLLILRAFFIKGKLSYNAASLITIYGILFGLVPICAYLCLFVSPLCFRASFCRVHPAAGSGRRQRDPRAQFKLGASTSIPGRGQASVRSRSNLWPLPGTLVRIHPGHFAPNMK